MSSNIVRFDAIRSLIYSSISASYSTLGTTFAHAMRVLHFVNDTNGGMMVSFDGVTDNVFIPAGGFALYDLTSDQDGNESFRYQNGTQLWVKYLTAPTLVSGSTTNTFYAIAIYGKGE
jgi:hypothetical protein